MTTGSEDEIIWVHNDSDSIITKDEPEFLWW